MQMLRDFFFYALYSSAVLVYGIGLNRAVLMSKKPRFLIWDCIKMLIAVSSSVSLSYIIVSKCLCNVGLAELYPFVAVLIFSAISVFIEAIVRITAKISMAEYTVSMLSILLSLNESLSLSQCVLKACFCIIGFYLCIPLFFAIRKRVELSSPSQDFKNLSLVFISIAILMLLLLTMNVSWLNPQIFSEVNN